MPITRQDLRQQLKRGQLDPVYLLYGPETYMRDLAAATLAQRVFLPEDFRDFNEITMSIGSGTNLGDALAAAEQLPMMSSRRVVTVRGIRIATAANRDTVKEDLEPILSRYLAAPPDTSVLIMVADEYSRNRKLAKLIDKHATVVNFEPLSDHELVDWAMTKAGEANVTLDRRSATAIVEKTGNDVSRVTNEINKLAAAAMPDAVITDELIAALVPDSRAIDGFAFANHLLAGRGSDAVRSIRKDLNDGTEPLQILGAVSYTMRRLLIARSMMDSGYDRRAITDVIKGRPSDHETVFAAARRTPTADLKQAIRRIAETDVAIKTSLGGGNSGRIHLEMLVCELALATSG